MGVRKGLPCDRVRHEQAAQYRLWQAMRVHRRFTVADLERLGACTGKSAGEYCRKLESAGYLRADGPRRPGVKRTFFLVRDTGPLAPSLRQGRLVDLNLAEKPATRRELSLPPGALERTVTEQGVPIGTQDFAASKLARHVGETVYVVRDKSAPARAEVYAADGKHLCTARARLGGTR